MVRARVVRHPSAYGIRRYHEIQNPPKRYSIVDQQTLHRLFDVRNKSETPPAEREGSGSPFKGCVTVHQHPIFVRSGLPGIANYSQETSLNEPGALDERLRTLVMQSFEGGGERLQGCDCMRIFPPGNSCSMTDGIFWIEVYAFFITIVGCIESISTGRLRYDLI